MNKWHQQFRELPHLLRTSITLRVTSLIILIGLAVNGTGCKIMPHNSIKDCRAQCKDDKNPNACYNFCDCVHEKGDPLNKCLDAYEQSQEDSAMTKSTGSGEKKN